MEKSIGTLAEDLHAKIGNTNLSGGGIFVESYMDGIQITFCDEKDQAVQYQLRHDQIVDLLGEAIFDMLEKESRNRDFNFADQKFFMENVLKNKVQKKLTLLLEKYQKYTDSLSVAADDFYTNESEKEKIRKHIGYVNKKYVYPLIQVINSIKYNNRAVQFDYKAYDAMDIEEEYSKFLQDCYAHKRENSF